MTKRYLRRGSHHSLSVHGRALRTMGSDSPFCQQHRAFPSSRLSTLGPFPSIRSACWARLLSNPIGARAAIRTGPDPLGRPTRPLTLPWVFTESARKRLRKSVQTQRADPAARNAAPTVVTPCHGATVPGLMVLIPPDITFAVPGGLPKSARCNVFYRPRRESAPCRLL